MVRRCFITCSDPLDLIRRQHKNDSDAYFPMRFLLRTYFTFTSQPNQYPDVIHPIILHSSSLSNSFNSFIIEILLPNRLGTARIWLEIIIEKSITCFPVCVSSVFDLRRPCPIYRFIIHGRTSSPSSNKNHNQF